MKKLTFERIGIILFCATLIGSGALTVVGNVKPIVKGTLSGMQNGYNSDGLGGIAEQLGRDALFAAQELHGCGQRPGHAVHDGRFAALERHLVIILADGGVLAHSLANHQGHRISGEQVHVGQARGGRAHRGGRARPGLRAARGRRARCCACRGTPRAASRGSRAC